MGLRILVTRPEPGAGRTGDRLAAAGFDPILIPLSEIRPVDNLRIPVDENVAAVALTSANAVRYLPDDHVRSIANLPVFAVGPSTAEAAREAGLRVELVGQGTAESLADEVTGRLKRGQKILYLTGRVRRPDFERLLAAAKLPVDVVETYDTNSVSYTTEFLIDLLSQPPVAVVLVYSVIAAEQICGMLNEPDLSHLLESAVFLCMSRRIADAMKGAGQTQIAIAGKPTEDAVMDVLNEGKFNRS